MNRAVFAVVLLSFVACSDTRVDGPLSDGVAVRDSAGIEIVENVNPAWSADETWHLGAEPAFVLEAYDGGDQHRLLDPASIDVDGRGRIIIADGNQAGWHGILVYDSLGEYLFQVGREGEGPGEFGQLWWAEAYRGDSLVGFDMARDRLSVFTPEGDFERSVTTPQIVTPRGPEGSYGYTGGSDAAYLDGSFLAYPRGALDPDDSAGPAWYRHLLLRVDPDGAAWDTLGTFEISQQYWTGSTQEQLFFGAISVRALTEDRLYFGRGERYEFGEYDAAGRLTRIVRRSHELEAVTPELQREMVEWLLERVRSSPEVNEQMLEGFRVQMEETRSAEVLPPYSAMLYDRLGYVWVEEFRWMVPNEPYPVRGPTNWSVFDLTGRWLGDVITPPGFILQTVTDNRAYGFVIDEVGVKRVQVYSLNR